MATALDAKALHLTDVRGYVLRQLVSAPRVKTFHPVEPMTEGVEEAQKDTKAKQERSAERVKRLSDRDEVDGSPKRWMGLNAYWMWTADPLNNTREPPLPVPDPTIIRELNRWRLEELQDALTLSRPIRNKKDIAYGVKRIALSHDFNEVTKADMIRTLMAQPKVKELLGCQTAAQVPAGVAKGPSGPIRPPPKVLTGPPALPRLSHPRMPLPLDLDPYLL